MTKIRKQKRRKTYRYNTNRKKLRAKRRKLPAIQCLPMKDAWERSKTVEQNLNDMGLVYDVNKTFRIPTAKESLQPVKLQDDDDDKMECDGSKKHVVDEIEIDANTPRVKKFRLPDNQVQWLSYLIDKYAQDYKAMAKDSRNYNQETWKQIRRKIERFKSIPEQYGEFLKSRTSKME